MQTFDELYEKLLKSASENDPPDGLDWLTDGDFDKHHLNCLLHPENYAAVWHLGGCGCTGDKDCDCVKNCIFSAIVKDENGKIIIDPEKCTGCGECVTACEEGKFVESRDILPALYSIKKSSGPVFAMIAPAFIGQFDKDVTPGKLRSAFKKIGFTGMLEVALFADILTLKEALEFDEKIPEFQDYLITSCCCPVWIGMIRKVYKQLLPFVPGSVSPMVACGRVIKRLYPDATTIFIGPCIAKKAEAREKDIADAVDFVLTFEETRDIFRAFGISPAEEEDDERDHSSRAGRIYARTGGVSEAVQSTVNRLNPERSISVKAVQADGISDCKKLLSDLREGKLDANFIEGMGCRGGCVGGPKAILGSEEGRINVNRYGDESAYETPLDSPYVAELLKRLGFDTVEQLINDSGIFVRYFD